MYKWIGIFSELDLSFSSWIYLLVFLTLIISFVFVMILNINNVTHRRYTSFFACSLSLIIFGIVGFIVASLLFFIIYALKSDFKKDYD